MDGQQKSDKQHDISSTDRVRLVSKSDLEEAIQSGKVVTRGSLKQQSSIENNPNNDNGPDRHFPVGEISEEDDLENESLITSTDFQTRHLGEPVIDLRSSTHASIEAEETSVFASVSDSNVTDTSVLPHWTDPPTGEVPIGFGFSESSSVLDNQPRWRDEQMTWTAEYPTFDDLSHVSGLGSQRPAADDAVTQAIDAVRVSSEGDPLFKEFHSTSKTQNSADEYSASVFAEKNTKTEKRRSWGLSKNGSRFRSENAQHTDLSSSPDQPDSPSWLARSMKQSLGKLNTAAFAKRVSTAVVFGLLALGAFAIGPIAVLAMASVVVMLCALEYFDAVRRAGYKPATLLALLAIAGMIFGSYSRGETAIPAVLSLTVVFTFFWYLSGITKGFATGNIAATLLGVLWTGLCGAYAALILSFPDRSGMTILLGAILCTIFYDSLAYIGGNIVGRTPLAAISPNKTREGLVVGTLGSVALGALVLPLADPWTWSTGLLLGAMIAVVAPIGDLAESMVKRDLGLKDMGRILPGHGGVLDRFDALLFVLPATYYLARVLNIA